MAKAIKRTPGEWLEKAIENESKGNERNATLYFKKALMTEQEASAHESENQNN